MREIKGNLWAYHKVPNWVVITTNGFVKNNNEAVMGRGVAKQCAMRYPFMPLRLGRLIKERGNIVHAFPSPLNILTLPVKDNWFEIASIPLIRRSITDLVSIVDDMEIKHVYMPRPGCGNGQLKWEDVKPLLSELDDRFTVVELY